jgi:amino acid transporter
LFQANLDGRNISLNLHRFVIVACIYILVPFQNNKRSSGLIREFTQIQASFFVSTVVVNAITNTLPGFMMIATLVFAGANIPLAGLLAIIMGILLIIPYGLMTSAMPRSSGDYVWVSRIIHPLVGVVAAFLFWVFFFGWLSYNGWVFAVVGLSAPLQTIGALTGNNALISVGTAISSDIGVFLFGILMILLPLVVIVPGIKRTGQAAIVCGLAILAGALALLFTVASLNTATFISRFNTVVGSGAYQNFIDTAIAAGWDGTASFTGAFSLFDTMVLAVMFGTGFTLWTWAHIPLVGELKNAENTKQTILAMLIPLFVAGTITTLYYYLFTNYVGTLNTAIVYLGDQGHALVDTLPFSWDLSTVFLPMISLGEVALPIVMFLVALEASAAAFFANVGNIMYPVRYMFAQAFDGVLPRGLAHVWERYHIPIVAYAVLVIGGIIWHVWQTVNPGIWAYLAFVVGGQVLLWIIGCLAAALFPYRMKSHQQDVTRLPASQSSQSEVYWGLFQ